MRDENVQNIVSELRDGIKELEFDLEEARNRIYELEDEIEGLLATNHDLECQLVDERG